MAEGMTMRTAAAAPMTPLARITPVTGLGMIAIRADLGTLGGAISTALGLPLPEKVRIVQSGDRALGWMSPDELLALLPAAEVPAALDALGAALAGQHALVADVSAMRCAFDVLGEGAEQAMAKLSPTDFAALPADGLRRSRAAQVPSAFWRVPGGLRIVAFQSVAGYLESILRLAVAPGTWLDPR